MNPDHKIAGRPARVISQANSRSRSRDRRFVSTICWFSSERRLDRTRRTSTALRFVPQYGSPSEGQFFFIWEGEVVSYFRRSCVYSCVRFGRRAPTKVYGWPEFGTLLKGESQCQNHQPSTLNNSKGITRCVTTSKYS
jgi:hypothetical protein